MTKPDAASHWDDVYQRKAPHEVSWYRPHLDVSLDLIARVATPRSRVLDVGGGESTLVDDLLDRGFDAVEVNDLSPTALEVAKVRLGARATAVTWRVGDITTLALPPASIDVWHDRAVFHFLTDEAQRRAYVAQVLHAVRPGGHVIVGTFGLDGPTQCSGLDVQRYDADGLHGEFGARFTRLEHVDEVHTSPAGRPQAFVYCLCQTARA